MRRRRRGSLDVLSNFALTAFKAIIGAALLAIALMGQKTTTSGMKQDIQYAIIVDWPGGEDDVDTWVRTPDGKIVMYLSPESGATFLERDDTGLNNRVRGPDGTMISPPLNEEIVAIRSIATGEYVVNLNLYRAADDRKSYLEDRLKSPIEVTVQLMKMNPTVTLLKSAKVSLEREHQEAHVFRFEIADDGMVRVWYDPVSIMAERIGK